LRKKSLALLLILAVLLQGCATSPNKIKPAYVSPLQYYGLSCEQIQMEMLRISSRMREVCGAQDSERTKDGVALAVGLVLFWPALFFMIGEDQKQEIARMKGEYEALEHAAIRNNCGFVADLQKAREEQQEEAIEEESEEAIEEESEEVLEEDPEEVLGEEGK